MDHYRNDVIATNVKVDLVVDPNQYINWVAIIKPGIPLLNRDGIDEWLHYSIYVITMTS